MGSCDNMAFTTKDSDNDIWYDNCAQAFTGAWWYSNCHHANLNGIYYRKSDLPSPFGKGINWKEWRGHYYSMKTVTMKIKAL